MKNSIDFKLFGAAFVVGIGISLLVPALGSAGESGPEIPPPGCSCSVSPPNYVIGPRCLDGLWETWDDLYRPNKFGVPCAELCGTYFVGCFDPNG